MKKRHIIEQAKKFCDEMNIKDCPVYIVDICKKNGITVFEQYLPTNVSGFIGVHPSFIQKYGTEKVIVVNLSDSASRRRFTIAHELAHYILHRQDEKALYAHRYATDGVQDDKEKEANIFASNILMPENLIMHTLDILFNDDPSASDSDKIQYIAKKFKVSKTAAAVRLDNLGLI